MPANKPIAGRYAFVAALLFALVTAGGFAQRFGWFAPFDEDIVRAVGGLRQVGAGQGITRLAIFTSALTSVEGRLILLTLLLPLFLIRRWWRGWLWLAGVAVSAMLVNTGLKLAFQAARPDIIARFDPITTYSFPSGHASGNMAFFLGIAMLMRRRAIWAAAVVLVLVIGCARVWLAAHWPSDVLCGWIEASAILMLARLWLPQVGRMQASH